MGPTLLLTLYLLQAAGRSNINIICEKQMHTGTTRFEDMNRLPLGITTCTASFSARLLAQVRGSGVARDRAGPWRRAAAWAAPWPALAPLASTLCHVARQRWHRAPSPQTNIHPLHVLRLAQVAVDPRFWSFYQQLGVRVHLVKWDAAELAGEQEELTYCQLQQRALRYRQVRPASGSCRCRAPANAWPRHQDSNASTRQQSASKHALASYPFPSQAILLGSYTIPERDRGIQLDFNPQGAEQRTRPRVWNSGDGRCKLLLLAPVSRAAAVGDAGWPGAGAATAGGSKAAGWGAALAPAKATPSGQNNGLS